MRKTALKIEGGKGSHRNFTHPELARPITISGKLGDDAKLYQEKAVKKAIEESKKMKDAAKYIKIVEWSEEDGCYVGSSPGLFLAGCHGPDEREVFDQLCLIVEQIIELYRKDNKPLPPATSGKDWANVA